MKRVGGLEIDEDMVVQERGWRVERIAWVAMLALNILALLGLFGTGPLSSASAGDVDTGIGATYERFVRHGGDETLIVQVGPGEVREGKIELWLSSTFLDHIDIQQVVPQPDAVRSDGMGQTYVFLASEPVGPITVAYSYRPQTIGRLPVEARIVDGPDVGFTQYVYP